MRTFSLTSLQIPDMVTLLLSTSLLLHGFPSLRSLEDIISRKKERNILVWAAITILEKNWLAEVASSWSKRCFWRIGYSHWPAWVTFPAVCLWDVGMDTCLSTFSPVYELRRGKFRGCRHSLYCSRASGILSFAQPCFSHWDATSAWLPAPSVCLKVENVSWRTSLSGFLSQLCY